MATNSGPSAPSDLPPPYSAVVGQPPYGFVVPPDQGGVGQGVGYVDQQGMPGGYPQPPKAYTAPGVYPHPENVGTTTQQPLGAAGPYIPPPPPGSVAAVGVVVNAGVGTQPTVLTCFNCGKLVTTKVKYTTAWHTHLVAGSICVMTMVFSMCCLGLIPYCFNTFKDAEHYCPNCNTFIGKCSKC